ncbi:MAG: hypothetical protein ACLQT7_09095 [Candidatus Dormibacteria bacterium]
MNLDISTENRDAEDREQETWPGAGASPLGTPDAAPRGDLLPFPSIPRSMRTGTPRGPALDADDALLRTLLIHEYLTAGRSVRAVAARLGIGVTSASAALRASGIPIRRAGGSPRAVPGETDDRLLRHVLIQEYVTDERSARSVAARLGIGARTVLAALRATDVPVRQAGGRRRRSRDPAASGFLSLATEWHAYWCGYLLALRPYRSSLHPHRFRIRAGLEDLPHLESLRAGLDTDAPIRTRSDPRSGDACYLQLESRSLAEALAGWGITPNSWAIARWPREVPPRWRAAHLRGYLEVAGLAAPSSDAAGFTIAALGSMPLAHDLGQCLAELGIQVTGVDRVRPGRGAVQLSLGSEDAARLVRLLYADATVWNRRARRSLLERLALPAGQRESVATPRQGSERLRRQPSSSTPPVSAKIRSSAMLVTRSPIRSR